MLSLARPLFSLDLVLYFQPPITVDAAFAGGHSSATPTQPGSF